MTLGRGHIALCAACLVAGIIAGAGLRGCGRKASPDTQPQVIRDSIVITDTVIREKTSVRSVQLYDTAVVFLRDTLHDTVYVKIPVEYKQYRDTFKSDSADIRMQVDYHGYRAGIDRIGLDYTLHPQTRTEVKKSGWGQFIGIGIGAGYGASVVGQTVYAAPEFGVHITYGWGYHW